jgi:protein-disulfide isomerase
MFYSLQCPFSKRAHSNILQLYKEYPNKIRLVFRHRPLPFHQNSLPAAQAAMAAHKQGQFWEFLEKIYSSSHPYNLTQGDQYEKYAKELGLNLKTFKKDLSNEDIKIYINQDGQDAILWNAQGTPTFFFNGEKIVGARPLEFFRQAVNALLAGRPIPQAQPHRPSPANPSPPAIVSPIQIGNAPTLGEDNAKHTIVVFSEFQCPFCYRAVSTIAQLLDQYPQNVRIVFKHFPLAFHRDAHLAAQAAMAAHAQGKFWEYHDKLFANQRALKRDDLIKYATAIGLDLPRFTKELDNGTYKASVDADIAQGNQLGVKGTPTFFVNRHRLVGAQPLPRFQELIDKK